MRIPGTIPVRTYLLKYVLYRENLQPGEQLDLNRRGTIPNFLGLLLTGKLNTPYRDSYQPDESYFGSRLHFLIDEWNSEHSKVVITMDGIRAFDSFLYHDFHDFLLNRIMYAKQYNTQKEKTVIEHIMHELNIIDDISYDAIKKSSYRLRNLRNIPHFRYQNCP